MIGTAPLPPYVKHVLDSVVLNEASFGLICLVVCCLLRGRNSLRNKLWKGWNLSNSPQLI